MLPSFFRCRFFLSLNSGFSQILLPKIPTLPLIVLHLPIKGAPCNPTLSACGSGANPSGLPVDIDRLKCYLCFLGTTVKPPFGLGDCYPLALPLSYVFPLQLCRRTKDCQHEAPGWGVGINGLLLADKLNPFFLELTA